MTQLDNEQEMQNIEIKKLGKELTSTNSELELKMNVEEGKKMWAHFSRFAEYRDLKELYQKVLPELANFEQKMINYNTDI